MTLRARSLPSLVLVAASLAALPGHACARAPRRAAHAAPAQSAELKATREQLARLQAQVQALEAKVAALSAAPRAPATQTAAPQPAAALAAAETQPAQQQPAPAASSLPAAPPSPPSTTRPLLATADGATRVSGRLYLNASTITQHVAGGPGGETGTGVNLKRAYLSVDHRFSPVFAAHVTLDADTAFGQPNSQNPTTGSISTIGKGMYIKRAYGEAHLSPALTVRLGAADTPWVAYAESVQGTRHIERTLIDRTGFGTSADWGVHVLGDIYRKGNTSLSYSAALLDGAGYRQVKVTGTLDWEARLSGQIGGLVAGIGIYGGKRGLDTASLTGSPSTFHTAHRYTALAAYTLGPVMVGGEAFYAKNWNTIAVDPASHALAQNSASGEAVFGHVQLAPRWQIFAHGEWQRPSRIVSPNERDSIVYGGVQFSPMKLVDIALVYKREVVTNGALATANGVIGCAASATAFFATAATPANACTGRGTYDEFGLFTQLHF